MAKKNEPRNKKSRTATNEKNRKIIRWMWRIFGIFILLNILIFGLLSAGVIGYIPNLDDLENPIDKYASQVISSDDKLLFTYSQSDDNRIFTDYSQLSPYLIQALVATEDVRFYQHSGIDIIGLGRAVVKTLLLQHESSGGGSTITQQLAKQLYSPRAKNKIQRLFQKPVEWVIAVKLERYYTKDEIINLYLNKYDFNYNAIGIELASHTYFNKKPIDLTIEEAATLVGMLKNSALYNPVRRPDLTQQRRNIVLTQMVKAGYLSEEEKNKLISKPIKLDFNRANHTDIPAPYYRQHLAMVLMADKPDRRDYPASWQKQQFIEDSIAWVENPLYGWCKKNKKADGSNYNLYTDGLKIYSTIDSRMQKYAEEAVREQMAYLQPIFDKEKAGKPYAPFSSSVAHEVDRLMMNAMRQTDRYRGMKKAGFSEDEILKEFKNHKTEMKVFSWKGGEIDTVMTPWDSIRYHKSFLRAGFMAMDPFTGHVKAYVGGPDFKFFKYDMVSTGKRQIGSTIKPFLYTLAMEEGMTPCDQMLHVPQTLITETGQEWSPKNAGAGNVGEMVTIKWGLQNSSNWVTAYLMKQFSPYAFARLLKSFGLKSPIDPVVSLALGICDASVSEMVSGYSAFANRGIRVDPLMVTRIEDSYGNVVGTFIPSMHEIFSESTSYKMLDMLRAVIDGGTGSRLRRIYNLKGQMGGKTGTTQNNSDGWFMSFTPGIVAGSWVGGEDRSIHFDRMAYGQGASMALPIHGLFYQKIYADPDLDLEDNGIFEIPEQFRNPCFEPDKYSPEYYQNNQPVEGQGIDDIFD
jgi:penicillin-binding protein 1A